MSHPDPSARPIVDMHPASAALDYVAHGWPVIACHTTTTGTCTCRRPDCGSPGKHPRTGHGLRDATTNPDLIATWWRRWPDANVAIATGTVSGLVVIDLDPRHGSRQSWATLTTGRHLPPLAVVATGRGGHHLYFTAPPDRTVPSSVGRLGAGIDVRGEGGYVIAPPSRHATGHPYRWHDHTLPPPPLPDWLTQRCQPPAPVTRDPIPLRAGIHAWAQAALINEAQLVATAVEGTRNHTLNRAAFRLGQLCAAGLLDDTTITAELAAATIASGLTAGRQHPRAHAPTHHG